jgi:hypothetical protein
MPRRLVLVCLAMLAVMLNSPIRARTQTPIAVLPNCLDKPEVRPTSVIFACGDGGVYADGVRWSGWGAQFATATATMHANDCTPNCAQGHFHRYAAFLAVAGSQRCPNGQLAYQRVSYVPRTRGIPTAHSTLDWFSRACR